MTTLESDLPTPPDEGDFDLEVLAARRRRRLPIVTTVLAIGVVAAAAFIGGVEIQKHYGSSAGSGQGTGASNLASFASRFRSSAAGGATGGTGTFGGGAGATIGTVTLIKGKTLYVTDTSGNTVKVAASAGSRVTKTVSSTLGFGAIHPGDSVVVRGTAGKNGTIAADSITLGALTGGGFGGGGSGFGSGGASGFGGGATGFGGGRSGSSGAGG
jgi:hypothetical protein